MTDKDYALYEEIKRQVLTDRCFWETMEKTREKIDTGFFEAANLAAIGSGVAAGLVFGLGCCLAEGWWHSVSSAISLTLFFVACFIPKHIMKKRAFRDFYNYFEVVSTNHYRQGIKIYCEKYLLCILKDVLCEQDISAQTYFRFEEMIVYDMDLCNAIIKRHTEEYGMHKM